MSPEEVQENQTAQAAVAQAQEAWPKPVAVGLTIWVFLFAFFGILAWGGIRFMEAAEGRVYMNQQVVFYFASALWLAWAALAFLIFLGRFIPSLKKPSGAVLLTWAAFAAIIAGLYYAFPSYRVVGSTLWAVVTGAERIIVASLQTIFNMAPASPALPVGLGTAYLSQELRWVGVFAGQIWAKDLLFLVCAAGAAVSFGMMFIKGGKVFRFLLLVGFAVVGFLLSGYAEKLRLPADVLLRRDDLPLVHAGVVAAWSLLLLVIYNSIRGYADRQGAGMLLPAGVIKLFIIIVVIMPLLGDMQNRYAPLLGGATAGQTTPKNVDTGGKR